MAHGYPDFEGDKSGLYLMPEWAAFEAVDRSFRGTAGAVVHGGNITVTYNVPAGSTLYITQAGFTCEANLAADSDLNQMCHATLWNTTTGTYHWEQGGNGGGIASFPKPVAIVGPHQVSFRCINRANHSCNLYIFAAGYEI